MITVNPTNSIGGGMYTTTQPDPALEARIKMLSDQHTLWLGSPITTEVIKQLDRYEKKFTDALTQHILKESNKELEDTLRASIKTCQTLKIAFTDTSTFVRLITTKPDSQ